MKLILGLACFGLTILFSIPSFAEVTSVYTDLSEKSCVIIPSSGEPEDQGGFQCKGPAGYKLKIHYSDLRASLVVVSPDNKEHDLDFYRIITSQFSSLGPKAEWRLKKTKTGSTPIAVITRIFFNENTETGTSQKTSYLAVAKITKDKICVTNRIKANGKENTLARDAADKALNQSCL